MEKALEGKRVAVFGATGRIGMQVCIEAAKQGADVAIHCNSNVQKAESIAETVRIMGRKAIVVTADVTDYENARRCVDQIVESFGGIYGVADLIHRDNGYTPAKIADMTWKEWETHIDGMKSYFHICKAVIPYMRKQHEGRIVYLSGGLAYRFFEGCAPFSAIKAGCNAFSKSLAMEEGPNNITVNVVAPGKVVTEKNEDAWNELDKCPPLNRFATKTDVANAVISFMIPENGFITGQTLYLAGGEIMPMP